MPSSFIEGCNITMPSSSKITRSPGFYLFSPADRWLRDRLAVAEDQITIKGDPSLSTPTKSYQLITQAVEAFNYGRIIESKRLMREAKRVEFEEQYEAVKQVSTDDASGILVRKAHKLLTEIEVVPFNSSYSKTIRLVLAKSGGTTVKDSPTIGDVLTAWEELDKYANQIEEQSRVFRDRMVWLSVFGLVAITIWYGILNTFFFDVSNVSAPATPYVTPTSTAIPTTVPTNTTQSSTSITLTTSPRATTSATVVITLTPSVTATTATTIIQTQTPTPTATATDETDLSSSSVNKNLLTSEIGIAIILFALMGAIVSTIRSTLDQIKSTDALSETQSLINEYVNDLWMIIGRLITGVVLAILACTLVFAGFIGIGEVTEIKLLVLSVAAGFSQDFVISAIRSVTGEKG